MLKLAYEKTDKPPPNQQSNQHRQPEHFTKNTHFQGCNIMKLYEIQAVANYLKKYNFIKRAKRVANNTIELNFGESESLFFDLTRGNSTIYKAPSKPTNNYNAPFDTQLHTLLSHAKIAQVFTPNNDKVIIFKIEPKSQYKSRVIFARFELTGRYTNLILTDENEVVLEALHHIDASKSYRVVKPGVVLQPLLPFKSKFNGEVADAEALLRSNFQKYNSALVTRLKQQKLHQIEKKLHKLEKELHKLPNKEELFQKAAKYSQQANIILANLHQISPYDTTLKTFDFDGNEVTIKLPQNIVKNRMSEYFFNLAKRAKNKAKNVAIELQNLQGKRSFYQNIKSAIEAANDPYELELLLPKQARSKAKKEKFKCGELFWIEGYKIMVGRNAKENQELLGIAKANDIWMHTKALPGSHVIIRTDKQNLPKTLLESAAKLCVDFSTQNPGNYEVDYTKRKFVKIQEGANVEYDKYQTIHVLKEGVEIRVE